jgi:hypothetical protein
VARWRRLSQGRVLVERELELSADDLGQGDRVRLAVGLDEHRVTVEPLEAAGDLAARGGAV